MAKLVRGFAATCLAGVGALTTWLALPLTTAAASTPPVLKGDALVVIDCVGEQHPTGCSGLAAAEGRVYAKTAANPRVKAVCAEHTYLTHAWRSAFCSGGLDRTNVSTTAWSKGGIEARADVTVGIYPYGY